MKVVILAGGLGTRLSEETEVKPKPMVEIGGRPILWHIMKHISFYGPNEFCIALGYRGEYVKKYFLEYARLNSDFTVQLRSGDVLRRDFSCEDWTIDLVDTGQNTMTGGRIKRLQSHIGQETFLMTYGDGVSNVDVHELIDFHRSHGKLATVTAVRTPLVITDPEVPEAMDASERVTKTTKVTAERFARMRLERSNVR